MIALPLLDPEDDGGLGEEGLALAEVGLGVEPERPPRGARHAGQHLGEDGAGGPPGLDAAVGVGDGFVSGGGGGGRGGG